MPELWFDPNLYAWVPGTVFGVACGILGSFAGVLAPQGKSRLLMVGSFYAMIVISILFLTAGTYAFFSGQSYGIWYGLGFPGLLGLILLPSLMPLLMKRYRQAEDRAMQAKDIE